MQLNFCGNKHIPRKAGATTEAAMAAFAPTLNVSSFLSSATRIDPNSLRGVPGRRRQYCIPGLRGYCLQQKPTQTVYVEYQVGGVSVLFPVITVFITCTKNQPKQFTWNTRQVALVLQFSSLVDLASEITINVSTLHGIHGRWRFFLYSKEHRTVFKCTYR